MSAVEDHGCAVCGAFGAWGQHPPGPGGWRKGIVWYCAAHRPPAPRPIEPDQPPVPPPPARQGNLF